MGKKSRSKSGTGAVSPVVAYREKLKDARKEYKRGRVFKALEEYNAAIDYGNQKCSFPKDSLVRAFAWLEIGLTSSLAISDYLRGDDEREKMKSDMTSALLRAMAIYEARADAGTLMVLRADEAWVEGRGIAAPVSDPERLGIMNYVSCTSMLCEATLGPTPLSKQKIERTLAYVAEQGRKPGAWKPLLAAAPSVDLPPVRPPAHIISALERSLEAFTEILAKAGGGGDEASRRREMHMAKMADDGRSVCKYKDTELDVNRAKDRLKHALLPCAFPGCEVFERHPKELSRCSGCSAVAYCGREHQRAHWKEHKPACAAAKARKEEERLGASRGDAMREGEAQVFVAIAQALHAHASRIAHAAPASAANPRQAALARSLAHGGSGWGVPVPPPAAVEKQGPQGYRGLKLLQLAALWDAAWELGEAHAPGGLEGFFASFVEDQGLGRDRPADLDLSPVADWHHARRGLFAVVEHTGGGSVLVDAAGEAFLVSGIQSSVESALAGGPGGARAALPVAARTILLPWRGRVVYSGVLAGAPLVEAENPGLTRHAEAYAQAKAKGGEGYRARKTLPGRGK